MSREEKKLSGAMKLFEALSGVDEELLAKADEEVETAVSGSKKKILSFSGNKVRLAASLAAAASLFLVVGAVWAGIPMLNGKKSADTATVTMESLRENVKADQADAVVMDVEEAAAEKASEMGESEVIKEETAGNTQIIEETTTIKQSSESKQEGIADCVGALKPDDRVELTEKQARELEMLGAYIPDQLPKGYIWESARAGVNTETGMYESVFVCWTKGMDSIMITVSIADAYNLPLTDITKKETYDVSLYDIPYAQSVPEEYRQSFDNPIFAAEDLSLELVQSRMKAVPDRGDTDTPRGDFSIIYQEGILLRFTGDGSAEEIWEMLR